MTNKRFVSLLVTMFLCFVVLFGSAGCGGDNNSSNFAENEPTNPAPNPVPTPIVSPDPVPKPTPSNPDPVPKPDSVPESPDVPEPTPASPDQPVPDPMPVVSPDQVTPTPLPEPEPEPEPEPAPAPYYPEPEPIPSGYTVFFDSKGGSIVPSVHVSSGSTVDMPENPTRDGYIFAGWYKDEDFTEIFTFGTDGDKITQNTRLYAQWFKLDTLMAEYAIGEIVIGYAGGDNPKYVTRNLTLPSKAGEVNIAWSSSNPDIISSAGTVTRPSDSDINVTLTATATSGTESKTKEFSLNVIRARYRVSHDVEVVPVQDVGIGDLSITYKLSSDQIVDIEGNYSKITIQNADDALDAIQGIHEALGINNPYEELQTFLATSDSYGSEYTFQQVYKGVKVFGRSVMASTNASGEGNFLHSSFLASSVLDSADMRINLSASEAEDSAKDNYSGNVSADTARTELIVYSLEDCENAPVYAYIVRVYGVLGNDYVDNTVLVNANSGESITQYPNTCNAVDIRKASGDNEFGHNVSFDVVYELVGSVATYNLHMSYVMRDPNHHICMYDGFRIPVLGQNWLIISGPTIKSLTNTWTDRQQVTVYANMREIMKWWEESFERNSLDGNGSTVNVVTHTLFAEDNAYWSHQALSMLVHDKPEVSSYDHFMGAAVDVLTHETTHGVLQHIANELIYKDASGAINEGYADVFACIKDANWQFGEDLFDAGNKFRCMRDIAELSNDVTLNKYKLFSLDQVYYRYKTNKAEKGNDYNFVHLFGMIVSHAAYLMHQDTTPTNGLTWEELGKVWYKSMHMGLSATSIFEDVRRCVLWAAQEINLPQNKIAAIKSAFDEVGITDSTQKATLKGTVTDYNTDNNLSDVDVVAFDGRISGDAVIGKLFGRKSTPTTGRYSFEFEAGTYPIMMRKEGYVVFQGLATITKSQDIRLDVSLVRPGNGSLSGTITRSEDKSLLYDVTVNIRSGWNVQNTKVIQTTSTDTEGKYSFSSLDNGYYTVELVKSGYKTATFNVTINGNMTGQDGHLSVGITDIPIDSAHFPDYYFRLYMLNSCDKDNNGILSVQEIVQTVDIDVGRYADDKRPIIYSLKGIEYFPLLQSLQCQDNQITDLDISRNVALVRLACSSNPITSLDVSNNTALVYIQCNYTQLETLDVSNNTALIALSCRDNTGTTQLTTLDVSNNTALQELNCEGNQLNTLDVSNNTALKALYCGGNPITILDVSHNSSLEDLGVGGIPLTEAGISNNLALKSLSCGGAHLTTLDISKHTALEYLYCYDSLLTTLDLSNNSALKTLYLEDNTYLTQLDLSHNVALEYFECTNSPLTVLDLSSNTALEGITCRNNHQLKTLIVGDNTNLEWIECSNNQLTTLNVGNNVNLQTILCYDNQLTTLDLSGCPKLTTRGSKWSEGYHNVVCDSSLRITWSSSTNGAQSENTSSTSFTSNKKYNDSVIVAVLPEFTPDSTETYYFDVSLDYAPPQGTFLVLFSDSEDMHGTFTETESPLRRKVSADLKAGRTYAPVVVAKTKEQEQSGGCNSGVLGMVMLMIVLLRKYKLSKRTGG